MEPPLPADVVKELEESITKLEGILIKLAHELFEADFVEAEETLRTLSQSANSFRARIWNEIIQARRRLKCCRVEYRKLDQTGSHWGMYWLVLAVVLLVVIIYIRIPVIEKQLTPSLG